MSVRFYSHRRGQHAAFSNFYPACFVSQGVLWPSSEHYFQAMKFHDPARRERVRLAPSPFVAKKMGRHKSRRCDWHRVRVQVMEQAVDLKFSQNQGLLELLLRTGDSEIVEASPWDYFWGCGRDGTGKNMLGRTLMGFRDSVA